MNSKRETGMAWLAATMLIIACILMAMCSCGSKKVVTETIWEHDTITIHKTDTLRDVRTTILRDTTHHETERIITLKESGDTIRIVTNNTTVRYIEKTDSVDKYKSIADSLKSVINKQHQKQEKVMKTRRPWTDYVIVFVVIAFALLLLKKIP